MLRFKMPIHYLPGFVGPDWYAVDGKRCPSPDKCENAMKAKIRLDKVGRKYVSGTYVVEFGDGKIEEGQFRVKHHHTGPPDICM